MRRPAKAPVASSAFNGAAALPLLEDSVAEAVGEALPLDEAELVAAAVVAAAEEVVSTASDALREPQTMLALH